MSKKTLQKTRTRVKYSAIEPPKSGLLSKQTRTAPVNHRSFWATHWRPLSLIGLLAIGLYIQSVGFGYVLDDSILIEQNTYTQKGIAGIADIFKTESFKGYFGDKGEMVEGGRYRPLSIATFALERSLFGVNPGVGHFINVLLYALTGMLLYRVLLLMFPGKVEEKRQWYFTVSFVATLLFIAHPLHVEVAGNIKGRDEILALMGEAGILYFTFRYLQDKRAKYLLYSFTCFFLGILSKESVITFLAIVPITAYFFTRSSVSDKVKVTLPLVGGAFIYLMIRYAVLGYLFGGTEITNLMNNPFYGMGFGEKTATIFYTLLLYLKLLVFPHPLTHDYYPYHIPVMQWSDWQPLLSLALYTGLAVVAIKGWKRKTIVSYAILFYLVTLSIVSNLLISIGTFMNERFVYHASLGFCIAVAWLLVEKLDMNLVWRRVALGVFVLSTVTLSAKTLDRLPDWKSGETLDSSALKVSYNSARANHFYGMLIWNKSYLTLPATASPAQRKAVLDSLKPYFDKALQILPSYNSANSMKAGIAAEYHKLDGNYGVLLKAFEEVNRTGTYEKFILEYLHYVNKVVSNLNDARQLEGFYKRMVTLNEEIYKNTNLPGEYRSLLKEIEQRMTTMQ